MRNLKEIGDLLREPSAQFEFGENVLGKISALYRLSGSAIAKMSNQNNSIIMEIAQGDWLYLLNTEIPIKGIDCSDLIQNKHPFVFTYLRDSDS